MRTGIVGDSKFEYLQHLKVARAVGIAEEKLQARGQPVRTSTGARTAIHPDDAAYARGQGAELDDELQVGEKIGALVAVGVPGKSPGEVAFYWPERKLLIVGDAVVGNPPGRLSLLREKVMDDPARLRESVRRLLALDFDALLVGDGVCVLHDAKQRLQELVDTFPK